MEDGQRVEEKLQEFRKVSSSNNCNSDAHTACPEVKAQVSDLPMHSKFTKKAPHSSRYDCVC